MFIVVMGVCGCGKTSVGQGLAEHFKVAFLEGDSFHPPQNIAKMSAGIPLDDADRLPWLDRMAGALRAMQARGETGAVLACSALKRRYRDVLRGGSGIAGLCFIHLAGGRELLAARLAARTEHYMPVALLDSQLAILEPLAPDEHGITLGIDQPVVAVVGAAIAVLELG